MEQSIAENSAEHTVNAVRYKVISRFKAKNESTEDLVDKVKRLILNDTEKHENM